MSTSLNRERWIALAVPKYDISVKTAEAMFEDIEKIIALEAERIENEKKELIAKIIKLADKLADTE